MTRDVHWCVTIDYQQIANDNIVNQIHGFTIEYGKFILIRCRISTLNWNDESGWSICASFDAKVSFVLKMCSNLRARNYLGRFYNLGPLILLRTKHILSEQKEPFKFKEIQMSGPVFYNLANYFKWMISVYKHWRHFRSRAQNYWCLWLSEALSTWSNPLLTDEFPARFSASVDTRISFTL